MAIEDARFVLPNACDTKMVVTMNARSLKNFFALRCCNRAQWEIREVAIQMLVLARKAAPHLFAQAGPRLCARAMSRRKNDLWKNTRSSKFFRRAGRSDMLVVIEGLDGSGKATQTTRLCEGLERQGTPYRKVSFPDYGQLPRRW